LIPQSNLSRLANRLAKAGGRRIPESVLERDYCLSWFLAGFSQSPVRDRLIFKGGTALKKCYFPDYRFSEDLDFTLAEEVPFETIREDLDRAFERSYRDSGVVLRYARSDRHPHANSHTFYLHYEGPLGNFPSGKEIKTDITIKEKLVFPIEERPILRAYPEYEDVPENAIIKVYSLKEIAAEKVMAVCDRARNEPRDLYDLWHLCENAHVDLIEVIAAIANKLEFRGQSLETIGARFQVKRSRLGRLWNQRLASQIATLPEFDGVFRSVRRACRRAGIISG
jgi:predicted nucleotidyltransferase component of viral defense system